MSANKKYFYMKLSENFFDSEKLILLDSYGHEFVLILLRMYLRSLKEGGSLTVLGAMNVENGNRVDDVVVEEFKGTANMELWLDSAVARTGLTPPVNMQLSGTRRAELLLSEDQQRDLKLLRSSMGSMSPAQALAQLLDMIAKTSSNTELLSKLKDWVELMKNGRPAGN